MDETVARKVLGEELARSFRSLVADMKDAMFLGEVPDRPEPISSSARLRLAYVLGDSAVLEVEPIGPGIIDHSSWGDVHRVKLVRVHKDGEAVI